MIESGNFDQFHVTVAVDTNGTAGGAGGANWENVCILDHYGTSGEFLPRRSCFIHGKQIAR